MQVEVCSFVLEQTVLWLQFPGRLATIYDMQPGDKDTTGFMVNPEIAELRQQVASHNKEIAELRGNVQQIDKIVSSVNRQATLQIAAIVISLCLTMAGGLFFQTHAIDKRIDQIDKRIDSLEKRMDSLEKRMDSLEKRMDSLEKRMDRLEQRFDDLIKELRAQRLAR